MNILPLVYENELFSPCVNNTVQIFETAHRLVVPLWVTCFTLVLQMKPFVLEN